jgi:hypothetical protein
MVTYLSLTRRNVMTEECNRCHREDEPVHKFCSMQVGYPICEECYDELRAEACGYEDLYNWQYED